MGSNPPPTGDRPPRSLRPWRALDERERRADERDAVADEREAVAIQRDGEADLREKWLVQREQWADERDALADEREAVAIQRDGEADLREKGLDERERSQADSVEALQQRLLETIGHARALLAADRNLHDRQQTPGARSAERAGREHLASGRAPAPGEHLAADRPELSQQLEWAAALRKQAAAALAALAGTEEKIARFHDQLAAQRPARADQYRRIAEQARAQAARAHEMVQRFNAPNRPR
ncbi:MAG: hypothetical protein ACM3ML_08245 [Micromonosporaceae bacterium]